MSRDHLSERRGADIVSFDHEGRRWTATFGRYANGCLAEIFLDAPKESSVADAARESAILASLALQHGCHLETLVHALDGRDVSPIGAALGLINAQANGEHQK